MMSRHVVIYSGLKGPFLCKPGVYFDPIGDELFILEYLGEAPCKTGELIPKVRLHFSDECLQGATIANGHEIYLGVF